MISSMKAKFKDVVAIVPVKGLTGDQLYQMTGRILETLHETGFSVSVIIADNGRINRVCFEKFGGGSLKTRVTHPYSSEDLFLMFDTVHLMKCIRNNWLRQKDAEKKPSCSPN